MSPEEFLESKDINKNFLMKCNNWKDSYPVKEAIREYVFEHGMDLIVQTLQRKDPVTDISDMEYNSKLWAVKQELERLKKAIR